MIIDSLSDTEVVSLLCQDGKVGILPSDTIFGIVARVADKEAVARLYAVKHREGKPGTLIAASVAQQYCALIQTVNLKYYGRAL